MLHSPKPDLLEACRRPRWGLRPIGPITASILDRLADAELQHGHIARAEHLSHLAAEMRGES